MRVAALLLSSLVSCGSGGDAPASAEPASAPASRPSPEDDKAALRALVEEYKKAAFSRRGEDAAALVARSTLTYFERIRKDALTLPEADLRKGSFVDRLMVVMIRAQVDAELLRKFDGRALFAHAIDEGMVGEDAKALEPGDVIVEGDVGKIGLRRAGSETPPDRGFLAYREDGTWRLDVMSVLRDGGAGMRQGLRSLDPDEDVAIQKLLQHLTGRKVGQEIWQPLDPPK